MKHRYVTIKNSFLASYTEFAIETGEVLIKDETYIGNLNEYDTVVWTDDPHSFRKQVAPQTHDCVMCKIYDVRTVLALTNTMYNRLDITKAISKAYSRLQSTHTREGGV